MLAFLWACTGTVTSSGAGADVSVAAVADAMADRSAVDASVDAADASSCGQIAPGDYLVHYTAGIGSVGCRTPTDGEQHFVAPAGEADLDCSMDRDLTACTITFTCRGVNGRFVDEDTTVYRTRGPGIVNEFVVHYTTLDVDTLGGYPSSSCSFDATYTRK